LKVISRDQVRVFITFAWMVWKNEGCCQSG